MKQTSETSFQPDWLALREPADHAARDKGVMDKAAASIVQRLPILDLGSGTGSTLRAFEASGHSDLSWRLFDQDSALLGLAKERHQTAETIVGDLSDIAQLPMDGVGLVTASALLDLMSLNWVDVLAKRLRNLRLPFYAALNYDGVMRWTPEHHDDHAVTALFNRHQRRDKGSGVALGPVSGAEAARIFRDNGFTTILADSPWKIGPDQSPLHEQLLDGIAAAVSEIDQSAATHWLDARRAALAQSHAFIGHTDILAVPATIG